MSGLISDALDRILPVWLRNRPTLDRGFKYVQASAILGDRLVAALLEGLQAPWPGAGTPTALGEIGATRGIPRGLSDTEDEYAARLRGWLDAYARMGSDEATARSLHEYLRGRPMVRVVDRHGQWTEIDELGNLRTFSAPWDWDSVSHPTAAAERPTDVWVIVYGSAYVDQTLASLNALEGIGHTVPLTESDQAVAILKQWKPAHNWIRCVLWVPTPGDLDPEAPAGMPDGTWGDWAKDNGSGSWVQSRNTTFRYWEP